MSQRFIEELKARVAQLEVQNQRMAEKVAQLHARPIVDVSSEIDALQKELRRQHALRTAAEQVTMTAIRELQNSLAHLSEFDASLAQRLMTEGIARLRAVHANPNHVLLTSSDQLTLDFFDLEPTTDNQVGTSPGQPSEHRTEAESNLVPATAPGESSSSSEPAADTTDKPDPESVGSPATPSQLEKLATSRNSGGKRKPRNVPTYDWNVRLDAADQVCAECGSAMQAVPSLARTSEMIGCLPMEIVKVSVVLHTYRCAGCAHLESACPPPRASAKGLCSLEVGAWCATEKYDMHMPLYRTERRLSMLNAKLSAQNQFDMIASMANELQPTYQGILNEIIRTSKVIHIDQTPWTNLQPGSARDYQLWCISTPTLAWYSIETSKGRVVFDRLLASFTGTIVSDAASTHLSAVHDDTQLWKLALCWAHMLRKFRDLGGLLRAAVDAVAHIQMIFDADKKRPPDADRSVLIPLVDAFFRWLRGLPVLPRTSLAEAVNYALNHEPYFRTFLTDPAIPMTNNAAERDIRPTVLGRHNHGGSRSPRGVVTAETFYTLCACARRNKVRPVDYIHVATLRTREGTQSVTLPWDVASYPHLLPAEFSISKNAVRRAEQ